MYAYSSFRWGGKDEPKSEQFKGVEVADSFSSQPH